MRIKFLVFLVSSLLLVGLVAGFTNYQPHQETDYFYNTESVALEDVESIMFYCTDAICSSLGNRVHKLDSDNLNYITFSYPTISYQWYAQYLYPKCYIPHAYTFSVSGYGDHFYETYEFYKAENCEADITDFYVADNGYENEPMVINVAVEAGASIKSAFEFKYDFYNYIYDDYDSAETEVTLQIFDEDEDLVYTDSKIVGIVADDDVDVSFEWVPERDDVYSARIVTDVTDCQCENSIKQVSSVKYFEVLPERAKEQFYSLIQGLDILGNDFVVGNEIVFDFLRLSNYIDDNYDKVSVGTIVDYSIVNLFDNSVAVTGSYNEDANCGVDEYESSEFSWIADEAGNFRVFVEVSADDSLYPGAENLVESMSADFIVGVPLSIDNDNDGYNSDVDCDDYDATVWQNLTGYVDVDSDFYGVGSELQICSGNSLPQGYSNNGNDCNNNDASINPGATEICWDGIDNNCDGNVDEGCGVIVCSSDVDCGTDGYENNPFCGLNNNVWDNYVTYICNDAGSVNSYCSSSSVSQEIYTCLFGCSAGVCLSPQCTQDSDCVRPGQKCESNVCVDLIHPECIDDSDCNVNERCDNSVCVSTLIPRAYWENSSRDEVDEVNVTLDKTLLWLVLEDTDLTAGTLISFELMERDTLTFDDSIRTLIGVVDANGNVEVNLTLNQTDIDNAGSETEYDFYFVTNYSNNIESGDLVVTLADECSVNSDCAVGEVCSSGKCVTSVCGDGILDTRDGEECDDSNVVNGDGCSSTCKTEDDDDEDEDDNDSGSNDRYVTLGSNTQGSSSTGIVEISLGAKQKDSISLEQVLKGVSWFLIFLIILIIIILVVMWVRGN